MVGMADDSCDVLCLDVPKAEELRRRRLPAAAAEAAAARARALADPTRLRLATSLRDGGELCVCDLAAAAGMAESATSHALRLLRAHRVVKARRAGRMMHYSLRDGHVRMLLDLALEHVGHADGAGPDELR